MDKNIKDVTEQDLAGMSDSEYDQFMEAAVKELESQDADAKVVAVWAAKKVYDAVKEYKAMREAQKDQKEAEKRAEEMEKRVKEAKARRRQS